MMRTFSRVSHLSLILLVQLVPAQISHPLKEGAPRRMRFKEVLAKSMCHPMEQLVDVAQEFPGEVGFIFKPACVTLWRCSGCCRDESQECHPALKRNITLQMIKFSGMISSHHVEITFVEHQRCDCRAHQTLQKVKGAVSPSKEILGERDTARQQTAVASASSLKTTDLHVRPKFHHED